MTAIAKTQQAVTANMTVEQTAALFTSLVLNNDLSKLTEPQRVDYYKLVCERLGLDPMRKPFELIILNGKLQMYATKECTAQLTALHKLTVTIVSREEVDGLYIVTARACAAEGNCTEDVGITSVDNLRGEAKANAIMKATTKAKRRAILAVCGLGMVDDSERDTIADVEPVKPINLVQVADDEHAIVDELTAAAVTAETAEQLTAVAKRIQEQSQAVKEVMRDRLGTAAANLGLKWSNGKFVEVVK